MSSTYIKAGLRRQIVSRADGLCEYCLVHESDTFFGCEVDHVVSEKHGGPTRADNLAYACTECNRSKGSDVGSLVPPLAVTSSVGSSTHAPMSGPNTSRWTPPMASRSQR